ncbi:MAG TPA: amino acid ABC transporter substrate-binding protein, partial [Stellaceae bacterium]|nr:amino acid ABC transporter substrate-binding protein [Stellaceae bacterium]
MIARVANLLLAVVIAAPACAQEIRIPVLVPLTGILALEGTSQRNGALLAISHPPEGVTARAEVADT